MDGCGVSSDGRNFENATEVQFRKPVNWKMDRCPLAHTKKSHVPDVLMQKPSHAYAESYDHETCEHDGASPHSTYDYFTGAWCDCTHEGFLM